MALDINQAWFGYEDHAGQPRATITTSNTGADGASLSPVAHVLDKLTFRQWQSPTNSDWFQVDFGANVALQFFTVVFARKTSPYQKYDTQEIASTDTVRHKVDAQGGTPGAGAVFDSGSIQCRADPKRGYHVCALNSAVTGRYWRCEINAASRAGAGFFLVMFAQAGPIFQPTFNHIYGETLGFPDNAENQRAPSSQSIFVTRNERTLRARLIWDFIPDSERDSWRNMFEYSGTTEPITFAISSEGAHAFTANAGPNGYVWEATRAFVGILENEPELTSRQFNTNIVQIQMTEHR